MRFRQVIGIETVAFNIAAGNFGEPWMYTDMFPRTLAVCTYLGAHVYAWPDLRPQPGRWDTSVGQFECAFDAIHARYPNRQHLGVITELP